MGHYSSFVVRIWCDTGSVLARGHVQHVGTRAERHFVALRDLTDFILSHLAAPPESHEADAEAKGTRAAAVRDPGETMRDG
jgi:hypothetical protein